MSIVVAASLLTSCSTANEASSLVPPADAGAATPVADVDNTSMRVAQVSLTNGTVSLRPSDSEEWEEADINQPVVEGSELFADEGSTGEVVLGDNRYVRIANGADVEFTQLDPTQVQLDISAGTVTLALDELESSEHYEINTPGGAIVPMTGGEYRVDIDENGDTWLTVRRGTAQVSTPNGSFELEEGDRVNLSADDPSAVEVSHYGQSGTTDDWDSWNDERRVYYTSLASETYPEPVRDLYGRTDIYGVAALAAAGLWLALDNDRYVWQPRVSPGWSPYENGYWNYSPRLGWTWISYDPWCWAPYHYGRWDYQDRYGWYWSPSDGITTVGFSTWRTRYDWRPAQVYVFQPPGSNRVMWVPLAYGEPYVAYTATWRSNPAPQTIGFVPRHLRERRGVVYVTDDGFNRRQRARRADRVALNDIDRIDVARSPALVLKKPARVVAEERRAKVLPSETVRRRAIVVRPEVAKDRATRGAARTDRAIRQADPKRMEARRRPDDVGRVKQAPRVTRQGGKMRTQRPAADRAAKPTPAPAAQPTPPRVTRQTRQAPAKPPAAVRPSRPSKSPVAKPAPRVTRQPSRVPAKPPAAARPNRPSKSPVAQPAPRTTRQPRPMPTKPSAAVRPNRPSKSPVAKPVTRPARPKG